MTDARNGEPLQPNLIVASLSPVQDDVAHANVLSAACARRGAAIMRTYVSADITQAIDDVIAAHMQARSQAEGAVPFPAPLPTHGKRLRDGSEDIAGGASHGPHASCAISATDAVFAKVWDLCHFAMEQLRHNGNAGFASIAHLQRRVADASLLSSAQKSKLLRALREAVMREHSRYNTTQATTLRYLGRYYRGPASTGMTETDVDALVSCLLCAWRVRNPDASKTSTTYQHARDVIKQGVIQALSTYATPVVAEDGTKGWRLHQRGLSAFMKSSDAMLDYVQPGAVSFAAAQRRKRARAAQVVAADAQGRVVAGGVGAK